MKVIMPDMAHNSIDNLFEYLAIYSSKNAIKKVARFRWDGICTQYCNIYQKITHC